MTMKLYILRPVYPLPIIHDPWDPWYDKCFGFVVTAESVAEARAIANGDAHDENRDECNPWLYPEYSTCIELVPDSEAGVVMADISSA